MSLNGNEEIQNESKQSSPPKLLILQKYKKQWAEEKNEIKGEDTSAICKDKYSKPLPLKQRNRIQASVSRDLIETERKVQLMKQTILQENIFHKICESAKQETLKKISSKEPETNKLPRSKCNGYRRYRNKSKNENRSRIENKSPANKFKNLSSLKQPVSTPCVEQQKSDEVTVIVKNFFENFANHQNDKLEYTLHENVLNANIAIENLNECLDNTESALKKLDKAVKLSKDSSSKNNFELFTSFSENNNIESRRVIHFEQPLVNKQSKAIDDHGATIECHNDDHRKTESMPWPMLDTRSKKSKVQSRKVRFMQKSIREIAETKNKANEEFLNFVENTTSGRDYMFHKYGNVMQIEKINSTLLEIKKKINIRSGMKLLVTAQFKEMFKLPGSKSTTNCVHDSSDQSIKQSSSMSNQNTLEDKENPISNGLQEKAENINFKKKSENIQTTPEEKHIETINITKKNKIIEYDDDMFKFEKPIHVTPPISEKGYCTMSSDEMYEYFTKLKQLHKTQSEFSIDSDDLSLDCSSEIDDLSALRGSTFSKFEAVTNKIRNSFVNNSNKLNQNTSMGIQASIKGEEKRISIQEKILDISNEVAEKLKNNSDDSGLGLKISNSTKSDSSVTSKSEDDSKEPYIIFHKHSKVSPNVLIQEIDSSPETETVNEENVTEAKTTGTETYLDDHLTFGMFDDQEIYSDDEFDIVNVADFGPCQALISKLKGVAAVQKAMATGRITEEEAEVIQSLGESNNNEKSTETMKCISSKFANSNVDEDDEPTVVKNNISEKVEADSNRDSGYLVNDCDNVPKMCNPTTMKSGETKRMQRIKSVMQRLKKARTEDIGDESTAEKVQQQEQQRPIDVQKNWSLRTGLILPGRQILKEIKKRNLHLHCKPILIPSMKQ